MRGLGCYHVTYSSSLIGSLMSRDVSRDGNVLTGCISHQVNLSTPDLTLRVRIDCLYKQLFSKSAHSDILYFELFLTFCPLQLLTMSKRSLPFSSLEVDCKVLNYSPTDLGRQSNVYWILYRSKSPFRQLLPFEIEKKITSFWNIKENAFLYFIIQLFFRLHPELLS